MNALEISQIGKSYGNREIFSDVSFSIPQNSIYSIVGKSGTGKSTILNMIGLLETIDIGTIRLFGEELPKIKSRKATHIRRDKINYLFQSFALINDKTVFENLLLAMYFTDISDSEKKEKIQSVIGNLELTKVLNDKVNTLSGGEKQRVALARCIVKPGEIILADEPTGSLDEQLSDVIFEQIKRLRDDYDKTIVLVTHDLEMAKKTDGIIRLSN